MPHLVMLNFLKQMVIRIGRVKRENFMNKKNFDLIDVAYKMRVRSLRMAYSAGKYGAHLGGGLSAIEIFAVLYGAVARLEPTNPYWEDRDIVLLGKAHGVLAYYTALYELGFLSEDDLNSFEQNGSKFIGHPIRNIEKGIEYSGGSLGMALSVGAGMALSAKRRNSPRNVYVILGDGECQEGSVWEALLFAVKYQLDNLTVIVDQNGVQSDGTTEEIVGFSDLAGRMQAFGCDVVMADGHDVNDLMTAFARENRNVPKVIIARTIKGKGVSFMEGDYRWHHSQLKPEQYEKALAELEPMA